MKKMMSILWVLAIVCGVSSSALSESKVAIIRSGEIFKVIYKSTEPASVKVTISDADGEKVFTEELISINGFIRPYNFSELPKGDYTICVTDLDGKKSEKICHGENSPTNAVTKWTAHISKLSNDEKKFIVAIPQQSTNDFSVHIYDSDNQLIYQEDRNSEAGYARVFNLKNLYQGATIQLVNHATGETKSLKAE